MRAHVVGGRMRTLLGMKQALGLVYCRASAAAVSLK